MSDKKNFFKTIGVFPAVSSKSKKENEVDKYTKRRETLAGGASKKENEVDKYIKRRLTLTGGSKLSTALGVAKELGKKTPIGRIGRIARKAAKYATKKVDKKNTGGMSKDRLTQKDVEAAKYQRAVKNKGGDRITQKDVEAAEKKSGGGFMIGRGGDYIKDLL